MSSTYHPFHSIHIFIMSDQHRGSETYTEDGKMQSLWGNLSKTDKSS